MLKFIASTAPSIQDAIVYKKCILIFISLATYTPLMSNPFIYVTSNSANDKIAIIDGANNEVVNTYTVSGSTNLRGTAITPNNRYLYVSDSGTNKVYVIDRTDNSIVTSVSVSSVTQIVAVTPDGNYVYVLGSAAYNVISTATNTLISGSPFSLSGKITLAADIAINSTSTAAYITDSATNRFVTIDITNPSSPVISSPITVGSGSGLRGIALASNTTAYIVNTPDNKVYPVTDLTGTPTVGTGITVGTSPNFIEINSNSTKAYVTNSGGTVSVITLATSSVASITVGAVAEGVVITSDDAYVYVANAGSASVSVIDTSSNTVVDTISVTSITGGPYFLSIASPESGVLDTTFGNQGITLTPISTGDFLWQQAIQTDDKILITGVTQTFDPSLFLARYTSGGSLDTSFNSSGSTPGTQSLLVGSRTASRGVSLQTDGKIVAAGFDIETLTNMFLARYSSTGALDTSGFNSPNGYVTQSIGSGALANTIGLQSSGKIIAAGASIDGGTPSFKLARFTSTGTLDTTFGTNGITTTQLGNIASIASIAIQSDDKIVAVGNSDNKITIARYTADGSLDSSFGTSGIFQPSIGSPAIAYKGAVDGDGKILVAGGTSVAGILKSVLLRCTSSGALDTTFNTTGYVIQSIAYGSEFFSLVVQPPFNYIVVGGYAINALCTKASLARYLANGTIDTSFGTSGITQTQIGSIAYAKDLGIQSTNDIIVTGMADDTFFVARYTS